MKLRKFNNRFSHNKFFLKYFLRHIVNSFFINTFFSGNKIRVYFLKLFETKIGNNTCDSEGMNICTGSHDFKSEKFKLSLKDEVIGSNHLIAIKTNN